MPDEGRRAGLLLAAGASRRFGPTDKLLAPRLDQPLIAHAAEALRRTRLDDRIAVIANPALAPYLDGFRIVMIPPGTQSDSLRAGVGAAQGASRLLITLGDMPDVTSDHLEAVIARATDSCAAASHDGTRPMPPACFPAEQFAALAQLSQDRGAGRLIRDLPPQQWVTAPLLLKDIDRREDLLPAAVRKYPGGCGGLAPRDRGTQA